MLHVVHRMVLALAVAGKIVPDSSTRETFDEQLKFLRQRRPADGGRASHVAAYQKLIEDNPGHPHLPEVMLDIASLYSNTIPDLGIEPVPAEVLAWNQKAASAARPGPDARNQAMFYITGRHIERNPGETRRLLKTISRSNCDSLTLARVQSAFIHSYLDENDLAKSYQHCLRLMHWYDDPTHKPRDDYHKRDVDGVIHTAGVMMINRWVTWNASKEERIKKFTDFSEKYGGRGSFVNQARAAIGRINA